MLYAEKERNVQRKQERKACSENGPESRGRTSAKWTKELAGQTDRWMLVGDVEQIDYGRGAGGGEAGSAAASMSQLFRPHQLMLAGSPTHAADDDAQMTTLNKSDAAVSAAAEQAAHVDRHGVRGANDVRTRPTDESGIIVAHEHCQ